jgi:succinate dehydrogenase hydrophobic anchor subunit
MTTGTGLFVLGAWLVLVAAYATDKVNEIGMNRARNVAWLATLLGLVVTAAYHPWVLAHAF